MPPTVSILICTHDRAPLLASTIQSIGRVHIPEGVCIDLLIVANACTDSTAEVVESAAKSLPFPTRLITEPTLGVSLARNRAMRESTGEILAFFDDDVLVDEAWLIETLRIYREFPADMVGGHVSLWWEAVKEPDWFSSGYQWILSGVDCGSEVFEMKDAMGAIGANFSYKRKVYETIGGYRTDLGRIGRKLLAGEETEYVYRALAAGLRVFHAPSVRVKHWVAPDRVTPQYVSQAIAGFTRGDVLMKPTFGPWSATRTIAGNLYLLTRHAIGRTLAALRGDRAGAVRHRVRMASSLGALSGAFTRIFVPRKQRVDLPAASTTTGQPAI
jgi:GT2 family glycosyltransferase